MKKPFIKNLSIEEAEELFNRLGEKDYRARQLFSWLYERNIESFAEMTNFSKELRKYLDDSYSVSALTLEQRQISKTDGTEKFLFKTHDNNFIESVLIRNDNDKRERLTICISSQAGCAMGCKFCRTAKIGFTRDLEPAEILDQINHIRRATGLLNNNIVFMGMGEPFMNYNSVLKAADIMNYSFGFHISARKITISTCGIGDAIEKFIDEKRPYNLAISLNDTLPEKRKVNMPVEKKFPILEISDMFNRKFPASRNRLTVVYIMRKDNISGDDAKRLKKLFKFTRIKLNLIPLNPADHKLGVPSQDEMSDFIKELEIINVPVSVRKSFGTDIDGACGQLSGKYHSESTELNNL
jgi:23S rRNA (adenine2503-C2)-methyltransferase